jgi:hypothetical protein
MLLSGVAAIMATFGVAPALAQSPGISGPSEEVVATGVIRELDV